MSITLLQTPEQVSLSQSPLPFSIIADNTGSIASSSFQYVGELYYWQGNEAESGSTPNFTLVKYPNDSLSGIFDPSRIINTLFQESLVEDSSQVYNYKMDFYYQYVSASVNVSSTHVESDVFKVIDGYSLFGENISQSLDEKTEFWPIMSDGPSVQTAFTGNTGRMGIWTGVDVGSEAIGLNYIGSNGQDVDFTVDKSLNTSGSVSSFPVGDAEIDFPLSSSLDWYEIQAYGVFGFLGENLRFNVECEKKYPNVRIKWKNRYGQWDYFNFNLVSEESFNTDISTYQKQAGTWQAETLDYKTNSSNIQSYIADSEQSLVVNTDYISEDYNDIFKQLLLSDEIIWLYDEPNNLGRPLVINTSNITFKTGARDKLIQYKFEFKYGQTYKLVL